MSKALVLACGNPQRGDDGVALQVVSYLRNNLCCPAAEFHCEQQWTPELAEPISQAEIVIFVDAAVGAPPGVIACQQLQPGPGAWPASTHHTSPESLLLLAEQLYGKCPARAYCITITGDSFEFQETLSDPVRAAVPSSCEQIKALLSKSPMRETTTGFQSLDWNLAKACADGGS